jgi:DNA repair exonuclease SbcCD nuclease subunit
MSKVLFTADWHINLKRKGSTPEWEKNRMLSMVQQLIDNTSDEPIIIGGDIFDKIPTLEELDFFLRLMNKFDMFRKVLIYPGNHEMLSKAKSCYPLFEIAFHSVLPSGAIIEKPTNSYEIVPNVFVDILPYTGIKDYSKNPDSFKQTSKVLLSHFRAEIPPHVKPEIDLESLQRWELVLAGDLHSYSNSQRNILYPGSPVTTSFHREFVDTGYIVIDLETLKHDFIKFADLPQLVRISITDPKDAVPDAKHCFVYEISGNALDLAEVSTSDLITKKVKMDNKEATLVIAADMSVEAKLKEYFLYVLSLSEEEAEDLVSLYKDIA